MNNSKYILPDTASLRDALIALNKLSHDSLNLFVTDKDEKVVGSLTDGDIRRKLIEGYTLEYNVKEVMNPNFRFVRQGQIDVRIIKKYRKQNILLIPVLTEDNKLYGIYDLKKKKSFLPIDAVLMAGGKGERLRPLTEKTPKPLLEVGDKCIIDHNIDRLIDYGVTNISVTVNYLKEQLIEHFREPRNGVQIKCIAEPYFLGTMGSIRFVEAFQNDYILVMNSDLFTNIDYEDLFLHFIDNDADMSVVAIPYTLSIPYGILDMDGHDIQGVKEKPVMDYYANAGIYLFKKDVIDLIPDNQVFNATDLIDALVEKGRKVIRFPLTGYWIDIGKHEEYKKAQELVKHTQ